MKKQSNIELVCEVCGNWQLVVHDGSGYWCHHCLAFVYGKEAPLADHAGVPYGSKPDSVTRQRVKEAATRKLERMWAKPRTSVHVW